MSIRMRHTRGHTGNRRSHHALKNKNVVTDKESGNLRLPHRLDEATGMYRGKLVVPPKAKAERVAAKTKGKSVLAKGEKHVHEHAHAEHANAEAKSTKGIFGKVATGGRPKARSGMGGGV
jgi:large subunit ribosomal protein L32